MIRHGRAIRHILEEDLSTGGVMPSRPRTKADEVCPFLYCVLDKLMNLAQRFYSDLYLLLKSYGLSSLADLDELKPDWLAFYTSASFGWAGELYNFVKGSREAVVEHTINSVPIRIFFADMRAIPLAEVEKILSIRASYACLFPRRVTFLSNSFEFWPLKGDEDGTDVNGTGLWCVPYDFLAQAFVLKPLLLAGLAILSPRRVTYREGLYGPDPNDGFDWRRDHWSMWSHRIAPESVEIDAWGTGRDSFSTLMRQRGPMGEIQAIRAPWLREVKLPTYVNLVEEEEEAFLLYDLAVSRMLKKAKDPNDSIQDALEDISVATGRLVRIYRQQRRHLNFKGTTVAIGSFVTASTFIAPSEFKGILGAIGGATAVQSVTWLRDRASIKRDMGSDDYWFLWRSLSNP